MESATLDFVAYAKSLAQAISVELHTLRAPATTGPTRREALARIFRQAHSLKGMAQAAGQERAATLAHELETALANLKTGQYILADATLDLLAERVDAISLSLQAGEMPFADLPANRPLTFRPKPTRQAITLPAALTNTLTEAENRHLREALGEGLSACSLTISLPLFSFDESLRALHATLTDAGEVIATHPLEPEEATATIRFRLLVATRASHEQLNALVEPFGPFTMEKITPLLPARRLLQALAQAGGRAAEENGKLLTFVLEDGAVWLSGQVNEILFAALLHLVRNAVGHGCEPPAERRAAGKPVEASILLRAQEENGQLLFSVSDDGRGIAPEYLAAPQRPDANTDEATPPGLIFQPGFSTSAGVSRLSGRGLGLDIVLQTVTALSGNLTVKSEVGRGTTFTLYLPLERFGGGCTGS